jgi:hypothetical protein
MDMGRVVHRLCAWHQCSIRLLRRGISDLLGVERLPRNLISGCLCCAAAACRNAFVAFMVICSCETQ